MFELLLQRHINAMPDNVKESLLTAGVADFSYGAGGGFTGNKWRNVNDGELRWARHLISSTGMI